MTDQRFSRRHFFFGSLLAGMIPAGGIGSAASLKRLGYKSPNEKLNIACIGAGGRATSNISGCSTENIVAFADVDESRAAATYQKYPQARTYKDFRVMLDRERNDVDAVIITIPDHGHAVAAMWAMERGKHVYCEKPLARTIWEARLLTEAAKKYNVATQMGNQGYSYEGERIAAEIVWSGEIGDVTEVHCWTDRPIWPQGIATLPQEESAPDSLDWDLWLGPAAMRPYSSAYCPFSWRGWFDFGSGALGDIACHVLGTVNMALRLCPPTSVHAVVQEGRNPHTFPEKATIEFQFPERDNMPPLKITWTTAAEGPPYWPPGIPEGETLISGPGAFGAGGAFVSGGGIGSAPPPRPAPPTTRGRGGGSGMTFEGRPINTPSGSGAIFVGEKGYLTADNYGANIRLLPQSRHDEYELPPPLLTRSPGHYRDWIRACKGGDPACSNFSVAGPFTEIVQVGVLSLHFEDKLEWDSTNMRVVNHPEANQYIKPEYREGWDVG